MVSCSSGKKEMSIWWTLQRSTGQWVSVPELQTFSKNEFPFPQKIPMAQFQQTTSIKTPERDPLNTTDVDECWCRAHIGLMTGSNIQAILKLLFFILLFALFLFLFLCLLFFPHLLVFPYGWLQVSFFLLLLLLLFFLWRCF